MSEFVFKGLHTGLLGKVYLQLGEPAKALENFETAETELDKLPAKARATADVRRDRAQLRDQKAAALFKLGKPADAEKEHDAALAELDKLAREFPKEPVFVRDVAFSKQQAGDFYLFDTKDVGRALAVYAPSYAAVAAQANADPDNLGLKRELAHLSYRMGYVAEQLAANAPLGRAGLRNVSRGYYAECLALRQDLAKADPRDTHLQIDVLVALGRLGRTADVRKGADALLKAHPDDRFVLFQTACALAIVSGCGNGPEVPECRKQALGVLARLVDNGWKDRVALETDPDLEAVRGADEFKTLVAKLPKR